MKNDTHAADLVAWRVRGPTCLLRCRAGWRGSELASARIESAAVALASRAPYRPPGPIGWLGHSCYGVSAQRPRVYQMQQDAVLE